MKRFLRYHGLSIVLLMVFVGFWFAQALTGWRVYLDELKSDHQGGVSFVRYLQSGHFIEATGENWESEFLQMGAFVCLTAYLYQKGSPESNDPDSPEPERPITDDSPWPVKRGGLVAWFFSYSLSIAFALLFSISLALHAVGGASEYSREQVAHGDKPVSTFEFIGTSLFWFQSFQNWQSEFLAIASMVYLTVFLRHRGSPESKDVAAPTWENDT